MSLAFPKSPCDEGEYHIVNIVNNNENEKWNYLLRTPQQWPNDSTEPGVLVWQLWHAEINFSDSTYL